MKNYISYIFYFNYINTTDMDTNQILMICTTIILVAAIIWDKL